MRARTELACLHHNHNVGRQQAHTAAGTSRYKLVFPKAKGEWVVKKVYKKTDMAILNALMHDVDVKKSLSHGETVECICNYTMPQDIHKNIATKEAPKKKMPLRNIRLACKGCSNITSLLCKSLLQDNFFINHS